VASRAQSALNGSLLSEHARRQRARRALVVGILAAAATVSMAQVANAQPTGPNLPPGTGNIAVDASQNEVFLVGHAKGFQIYTCNGATSTWGPGSTPDAKLFDDSGELVAKHFGGPTWEAKDGSSVVGRVPAKEIAPAPRWQRHSVATAGA
jgi:hypothetical protein